jgi:signal transduction histidine kinase
MSIHSTPEALLIALLDRAPCGLAYLEPVNSTGPVTDFTCRLINPAARHWLGLVAESPPYPTIKTLPLWSEKSRLFDELISVWQTRQPAQWDQYYVGHQQWASLNVEFLGEGLMISFEAITRSRVVEPITFLNGSGKTDLQQQQLLTSIVNSSLNGIVALEAIRSPVGEIVDFRVLLASPLMAQLASTTPDAMAGQLWSHYFPDYWQAGLFDHCVQVLLTGTAYQQEFEQAGRWMLLSAQPLGDTLITLTFQDVTQQKETQLAQQHQNELLESILMASEDSIVAVDAVLDKAGDLCDLVYRLMNSAGERTINRRLEDIQGRTMLEVFPAIWEIGLFDIYKQVWVTGRPHRMEQHWEADGVVGWFLLSVVRRPTGLLITVTNTTHLQEVRQQLQQQVALLEMIMANVQTGVVLFSAVRNQLGEVIDFIHTFSNPVNDQLVGRGPLAGCSLIEHFPENLTNGYFDDLLAVLQTSQGLEKLKPYQDHGINGWFQMQFVRQGDGVLFTYQDVTALKKAELDRQRQAIATEAANRELRRSNEYLQQFAYVASHDLQEPLRKIQSFGDLLKVQYKERLDDHGQDLLSRMQKAAWRMSSLVRDLLAYSRLATEPQPFEPVSLGGIVSQVLSDQELTLKRLNAQIEIGELPTLMADQMQMHQLLSNLIGNALKYNRPDVQPSIRIQSRSVGADETVASLPPGYMTANPQQLFWEISIKDNGIGFEEKYLDRVFGMFQRLHGKGRYEGSGMGLAICKRVTDNHQGYITARSQPGQGATFLVYLPR